MKQLRIRAYLQTPIISDKHLPLDAILYYHHVRRHLGEEVISKPGESTVREATVPLLPIKKGGRKDDTWFYHCSFAQWPEKMVEDSSFKVKSGDWLRHSDYLIDKVKKIDVQRGKHKAYQTKRNYRFPENEEWYCEGVQDRIMELLNLGTAIGRNTVDAGDRGLNWE